MARGTSLANMALGDFRELTSDLPDTVKIPVSLVFIRTLMNGECEWTLTKRDELDEKFQLQSRDGKPQVKDVNLSKYGNAAPPAQCSPKEISLEE